VSKIAPAPPRLRCAIHTRKSSEEGLDQSFNSLHAQRGTREAHVKSQAGDGWTALPALYDDGGFTGGNMERSALKQLLDGRCQTSGNSSPVGAMSPNPTYC
jgi:site-specific DNA recombinase